MRSLPAPLARNFALREPTVDITLDGLAMGSDAQMAVQDAQAAAEDDGASSKEFYTALPMRSRKRERELLGRRCSKRADCFFCSHVGERNEALVQADDVNRLIDLLTENIGRMDNVTLAQMVSEYYEERVRGPINRELRPGERPLPPMPPERVLAHIRLDQQDPRVKQVVQLEALQEIREEILQNNMMERSSRTGKKRVNKHQLECLEKVIKLEWFVQHQDVTKASFYASNKHIDEKNLEGIVSRKKQQSTLDMWRTRARRR